MYLDKTTPVRWGDKRYHSLNFHLRQRYGEKVFKVPLDAGFTCPNRDGTLSYEGCLFCSPRGSGDFAGARCLDISEQFEEVKQVMHNKWPLAKYIAYFQAFSNTYDQPERLRRIYLQAAALPGVVGLAIATRPDCLPLQIIEVLNEVNQHVHLWVELGLQTIHQSTGLAMNLHYNRTDFEKALCLLRSYQIETCAHIILGLPGESCQEMLETAQFVAQSPVQGIKIHLLHVMKDTPLGRMYHNKAFEILDQEQYVNLVVDILEILPKEMVIHRLTGDSPRDALLAPLWSLKKWEILNRIDQLLLQRDTWQGKRYQHGM